MSQPILWVFDSPFRTGSVIEIREAAGEHVVPGEGQVPVVFTPDDFRDSLGKTVPLSFAGEVIGQARVRDARVEDDGRSVLLTYEITDLSPGQAGSEVPPGNSS